MRLEPRMPLLVPQQDSPIINKGRNYHELLEIGRQFGVKPAMEYLGFVSDINTIEAAWEIIENSRHPDATIVIDPFHCFRGGGPIASVAKLPADRIAISHFNDSPATPAWNQLTDADRVMPGEHLRFEALLR